MVLTRTYGIDKTHGIENTHGNDSDSWYRIGTPESHAYERAECYPYAGFFLFFFPNLFQKENTITYDLSNQKLVLITQTVGVNLTSKFDYQIANTRLHNKKLC